MTDTMMDEDIETENRTFRQRMDDLHSSDVCTRRRALRSFRNTRSEVAIQAIIEALDDPDVASAAAKALSGHRNAVRAVPKLISLLRVQDHSTRSSAACALAVMRDPRALEPLAALLNDPDKQVRLDTARALGYMGDHRAIQPMVDAISECEPGSIRAHHIWRELGEMGFADDVRYFPDLFHSKDWNVRPEHRLALLEPPGKPMRRLPPEQIEKIRREIEELGSADYKRASRAISRLGRRRGQVVELLAEATASPHEEMRHLALHALEQVGDPRAGPVVLAMADDPIRDTWWCAYEILGKLWKERAIPILSDVLRNVDADSAELQGAAEGLTAIDRAAIPTLSDMIETGDSELRQRASWALRDIPDEAVIEPLSKLLSDLDSVTRWTGIESLSRLGQDNPQSFGRRCLALIEPFVNDPAEDVRKVAAFEREELRSVVCGS